MKKIDMILAKSKNGEPLEYKEMLEVLIYIENRMNTAIEKNEEIKLIVEEQKELLPILGNAINEMW